MMVRLFLTFCRFVFSPLTNIMKLKKWGVLVREKPNYLCLDSHERKFLIHSFVVLENQLKLQNRYMDCVDEQIFKVANA